MTAATFTTTTADSAATAVRGTTRTRRPLLRTTVAAGALSAVVVTAAAAIAHAAGVSFEIDGETIPFAGFTQMTAIGAIVGGLLAKLLSRRGEGATARRRFLQITTVLTIASCVPSVAMPQDVATKVALVATHVLAAAVIVPALARKIAR